MKNEFDIIAHYFNASPASIKNKGIIKSIGDDCAVINPDPKQQLVLSTDTLIEGIHFPKNTTAQDIASKALAVNLSDLAAMGAKPAWFTLAITLNNHCDKHWLKQFSSQLHKVAAKYSIVLVGGDTTHGDVLSITIQVHGYVNKRLLLRSKAKVNDIILLSGKLGAAALGLKLALKANSSFLPLLTIKQKNRALHALNCPKPAIKKGLVIRHYANSAIDLSDGLLADLGHILEQSKCGAIIDVDRIPIASCLKLINKEKALLMALTGGDDYKLCATLSKKAWQKLKLNCGGSKKTGFYPIGQVCKNKGIFLLDKHLAFGRNKKQQYINQLDGKKLAKLSKGYNHFNKQ